MHVRWVVLALAVLAVGAIVLPSFLNMNRKALNYSQAANVHTVGMALEAYAREHRRLPATEAFPKALLVRNYLPGNRLPKPPWSADAQPNRVPLASCPFKLTTAAQHRGGRRPTSMGTEVGSLHPAGVTDFQERFAAIGRGPFDGQTPGALLYDATPDGQWAVLYGLGIRQDRCIVAEVMAFTGKAGPPRTRTAGSGTASSAPASASSRPRTP